MCKNLIEKGNLDGPLILYNRTKTRADDLATMLGGSSKAVVVSTISNAIKDSDIIFVCVGDDSALKQIVDSILETPNVKGKLVIDCSTVAPYTEDEIGQRLESKGVDYVACPVFGAPAMADAGQLIWVMAGPQKSIDKALPYGVGVTARAKIVFANEAYSKAPLLKIIGNSMILQMVESIGSGLTLAEKSGLGVEHLHEWIGMMWPGPYPAYSDRMIKGMYYKREEPLFAVPLARKDARHALDIAGKTGAKLRAVELVADHLRMVEEEKGEKGDMAGIYGVIRKESGMSYEN